MTRIKSVETSEDELKKWAKNELKKIADYKETRLGERELDSLSNTIMRAITRIAKNSKPN